MSLLIVETLKVDQLFGDRWRAWLCEQHWEPPVSRLRSSFDHFPFLLYEHFAKAPMEAARRIALASRAMGMAAQLEHVTPSGHPDPSLVEDACAWLRALAREQLEPVIPAGASTPHATAAAFAAIADRADLLPQVHESQTHLYAGLTLYEGCLSWKEDPWLSVTGSGTPRR